MLKLLWSKKNQMVNKQLYMAYVSIKMSDFHGAILVKTNENKYCYFLLLAYGKLKKTNLVDKLLNVFV